MCFHRPVGEDEVMRRNEQLAQKKTYTINDLREMPEDVRAELIDGQIFYFASPKTIHQRITLRLYTKLQNYIDGKGGACEPFAAPMDVCLDEDDKTLLEPDVFAICDKKKIHEDACYGAPDLVIEVASKSTRKRDYGIKMMKYRSAGVKEYWVVDPDRRTVYTCWFEDESINCLYSFEDEISFGLFPDLTIQIQELINPEQKFQKGENT